jgi:hypothetical protein
MLGRNGNKKNDKKTYEEPILFPQHNKPMLFPLRENNDYLIIYENIIKSIIIMKNS